MGHQHVQGTYASEQKICPRGTYRNSSACSRSAWPGPSTKARGPLAAAAAALLMLANRPLCSLGGLRRCRAGLGCSGHGAVAKLHACCCRQRPPWKKISKGPGVPVRCWPTCCLIWCDCVLCDCSSSGTASSNSTSRLMQGMTKRGTSPAQLALLQDITRDLMPKSITSRTFAILVTSTPHKTSGASLKMTDGQIFQPQWSATKQQSSNSRPW